MVHSGRGLESSQGTMSGALSAKCVSEVSGLASGHPHSPVSGVAHLTT
jgi:hypothetical protein